MTRLAARLALAGALVVSVACSRRTDASDWLGRAEAAHVEATRHLEGHDVDGARAALRDAAQARVPGDATADDARIVRQDLYARLATLELGQGQARQAAAWATAGLDLGRGKDVFTTNLLIVRGRAMEQLGDASSASRDYHDALVVTEALLDQSLGGAGQSP
jgi:hypothetical protein